jgi:hypothetical protein
MSGGVEHLVGQVIFKISNLAYPKKYFLKI